MAYNLSEGSLEVIMNGGHYDKPVMQVLGSKKIQGSGANERYRLLVSDGKHSHSFAMLATQLNDKLITGELSDYSVVQIDRFVTSLLKNTGKGEKRVMIILDLTIMAPGSEVGKKLGNPQTWSEESAAPPPQPTMQPVQRAMPSPAPAPRPTAGPNLDNSLISSQMTHPIASLSPYQNKWVIKARVMTKSPIRTWSNAKGEGKLFSMDLCDESGEIRATAFRNECEKFYDMIQVDKVYYISRCQLKTANKQFTSLKNDYEMTFNSETVVAECMEDASSVPTIKYDFVPINEIGNKATDSLLDVIGVCKSTTDVQELTARSTGKLLKKRELTLMDSTGGAVGATVKVLYNCNAKEGKTSISFFRPFRVTRELGVSQLIDNGGSAQEPSNKSFANFKMTLVSRVEYWDGAFQHRDCSNSDNSELTNNLNIYTENDVEEQLIELTVETISESNDFHPVTGRRFVDLNDFLAQLQNKVSFNGLSACKTENFRLVDEKRLGLTSKFKFECNMCHELVVIKSEDSSDEKCVNANIAATSGIIALGIGYSQFQEVFSALDAPVISTKYYGKIQNQVYEKWEGVAVESMESAALCDKEAAIAEGRTKNGVVLTLWGNEAETFDGSTNPVVSVKGARLSEFNGSKSLSCLASSMVRLNPDLPEAHKLRGWYDNGGADMETVNISAKTGLYSGGSNEWITFSEAESRQLGSGDKGDYYSLLGVITFTFADNAIYKACPQEQCNKKLVDQENGLFRCEKCNREYPNYKYRLLLGANVSDPTGDQRITAFNEAAEAMLGRSAADLGKMFDYDKAQYTQCFEEVKFKSFVFKFRTKMETYSDEARLKITVMNAQPVDYKDANSRLIKSIKSVTGVEV